MKQNITVEQLNELSEKGKEILRKWCKNNVLTDMTETRYSILPTKEELTKLYERKVEDSMFLSIGQMIEFLRTVGFEKTGRLWTWYLFNHPKSAELDVCDLFWEAVKEVLEK